MVCFIAEKTYTVPAEREWLQLMEESWNQMIMTQLTYLREWRLLSQTDNNHLLHWWQCKQSQYDFYSKHKNPEGTMEGKHWKAQTMKTQYGNINEAEGDWEQKPHLCTYSPMVKLFNILVWATRRTKSVRTVKQSFVRARMYTNTHKHILMFTWLSHPGSAEDGQLHLRAFGHDSSCDERSSASQSVISEVSPKHPPSRKQLLRRRGNASTFSSTKHSRNISTIRSESQRTCSRKQAEVADYDWMWWKGNK